MKIDNSFKPSGTGSASGTSRSVRSPSSSATTSAGSAAEVRLSAASAQLSAAGNDAPVDSAQLAAIKQAIQEGRFTINAGAIADGVLQTARNVLANG